MNLRPILALGLLLLPIESLYGLIPARVEPGDLYVAGRFGKMIDGTLIGDNLGKAFYVRSGTGVVIDGGVCDGEGLSRIEGFNEPLPGALMSTEAARPAAQDRQQNESRLTTQKETLMALVRRYQRLARKGEGSIQYFDTLTDLLAADPTQGIRLAIVSLEDAQTSDEAWFFCYDPSGTNPPSEPTVLKPAYQEGRWLRTLSTHEATPMGDGVARPELFGAVADDGVDDYAAITNTLDFFGEVQLGPGIYLISNRVLLRSDQQLLGSGMESTTLRLTDNSVAYAATRPGAKYWVIGAWGLESANCRVADLTVDGNLSGQVLGNYVNTMHCVALDGYGHTIERVRAIGYGVGAYTGRYQECFPLLLSDGYGRSPRRGHHHAVIGCEVGGPALSYRRPYDGDFCCIVVWAKYGSGELRGNYVHDLQPDATNRPRSIHALAAYGTNVRVVSNVVERIYGNGVYGDSWTNENITIESNLFRHVLRGVWLNGGSKVVYSNIVIRGNAFHCSEGDFRNLILSGSHAKGQVLAPSLYVSGTPLIRKLTFVNNSCAAGSPWNVVETNSSPVRIVWFQATNAAARTWNDILIVSNTISVGPLESPPRPGEGLFWWREARFCRTNRLYVADNWTDRGSPIGLTAVDAGLRTQFVLNHTPAR